MESLFIELIDNMKKQEENIKNLFDIAREHNRALRQLDTTVLSDIVGREEALLGKIDRNEKVAKKITAALAKELGMGENAGYDELADKAPQDIRKRMKALLETMRNTARDLAEVNNLNGALTRQAMKFNEIILKTFSPAGKNIYTPRGKRADDSLNLSLLDRKA